MPPRIFTSYRRIDHVDVAERIRDQFAARFGRDNVFIDFDSIPPATKWKECIRREIIQCDALVIIIGPRWLEILVKKLADNEEDYVYFEIDLALAHDKLIVPICIKGATLPPADELPRNIQPILDYNATYLDSGLTFLNECNRLLDTVEVSLNHRILAPTIAATSSVDVIQTKEKRNSKISLKLEMPISELKADVLVDLVAKLVEVGIEDISIVGIHQGSIIIDLEMQKEVAEKLVGLLKMHPEYLEQFGLSSVSIDNKEVLTSASIHNPDYLETKFAQMMKRARSKPQNLFVHQYHAPVGQVNSAADQRIGEQTVNSQLPSSDKKSDLRPRSSWSSGSYYLAVLVVLLVGLGVIAFNLPFFSLVVVLIAAPILLSIVGAFQLQQDERLSEKSFLTLMRMAMGKLPLIGTIVESLRQPDSKDKGEEKQGE